jgi:hypothetical protein
MSSVFSSGRRHERSSSRTAAAAGTGAAMEVDSTPVSSYPTDSQVQFQQGVNNQVLQDLLARMSRCHTFGELMKTVPAPAQEITKTKLEKVVDSFTRQGACETLKATWQDFLNKSEFNRVPELNSLKAPTVQISKLAKEVDQVALNNFNFDTIMQDARRATLVQMIALKQQEIKNLKSLCNERSIRDKLFVAWTLLVTDGTTTPEHANILTHEGCAERLVQMAISIGQNSLAKTASVKQKKQEKLAEADKQKTDLVGNNRSFESMFKEMMRKEKQSEGDRRKSGKGKGRAGPPNKSKNQKPGNEKRIQKKKKSGRSNAKGGKAPATSTGRQPRKR